jgi:hypothetical protein
MTTFAYLVSDTAITVTFHGDGTQHTWLSDDQSFARVKAILNNSAQPQASKAAQLRSMMTTATERAQAAIAAANAKVQAAENEINDELAFGLELRDGVVYHDDEPIDTELTRRLVEAAQQGFDASNIIAFLNRIQRNPSFSVVQRLYTFLSKHNMPINPDGTFLAYKIVRNDYKDVYTGKMDNSVGKVLSVPRSKVDDDMDRTCSYGLHACSRAYLPHYGSGNRDRVVIVAIGPENVVAIPRDYNDAKMRCSGYKVVGELPSADAAEIFSAHAATSSAALRDAGINMADEYEADTFIDLDDALDADDSWTLSDDIDTSSQTLAETFFINDEITGEKIPANGADKRAFNRGDLALYRWNEEDRCYEEVDEDEVIA